MLKRIVAGALILAVLLGLAVAIATGGSAADPLVSKDYLEGTYRPAANRQIEERTANMGEKAFEGASEQLRIRSELYLARANSRTGGEGYAATFREQRWKQGDTAHLDTGSSIVLLAGSAQLQYSAGAVIDVTEGTVVPAGTALTADHRYLMGENTLCAVTVTSASAVLAPQGYYVLDRSDAVDYQELADALKTLGVFQGSSTGYGSAYGLENRSTRIQGVIMFLRLIGEEKAALECTDSVPYPDVPAWCRGYVAYATQKGYIKGFPDGKFYPDNYITSQQFLTLLLRALGYRDSGENPDFTFDTAISQAQDLGLITPGEQELARGPEFLRAHLVYFSYYALSARPKGSWNTLSDRLVTAGVLSRNTLQTVNNSMSTKRLS